MSDTPKTDSWERDARTAWNTNPALGNVLGFDGAMMAALSHARRIERENSTLRELVDGARVVVEIFPAGSPAQRVWQSQWLEKAESFINANAARILDTKLQRLEKQR